MAGRGNGAPGGATTRARSGRLTADQVAELRRWALRVGGNGSDGTLQAAAKAVVKLANEVDRLQAPDAQDEWSWFDGENGGTATTPTPAELEKARVWANSVLGNGSSRELKAAARAIILLADDVEALQTGTARRRAVAAGSGGSGLGGTISRAGAGWRKMHPLAVLALVVSLVVVFGAFLVARAAAPGLDAEGPENGALVGAADLETLSFSVAADDPAAVGWAIDGEDVTGEATFANGRSTLAPRTLGNGEHTVSASMDGLVPWSGARETWALTVDTTPPAIEIPGNVIQAQVRTPYVLKGSVGPDVTLTADGRPLELADGAFTMRFPQPPTEALELRAEDEAGNATVETVSFAIVPRRPAAPMRAVHVTADAWASDELRAGVLRLIDEGKVNTVELDLKDESGVVGWNAPVPLGKEIGAVRDIYNLRAAVRLLHEKGVRVVGRLVVFRDPVLGEWAWTNGEQDLVVQTPGGDAYTGGYGGYSFTNFASPDVRAYNVDVAVAAAKLGVDDILYDYIRRPDGPVESMVFPGLDGAADDAIVAFLEETQKRLAEYGTFVGASVFGVAATRPDEIAQNVPLMAEHLDYVAPMVYPSHWGTGEYGLTSPESQPYEIVAGSLQDFKAAVRGTGARVVPWLQDFSLGITYGPEEVEAQIQATKDVGISEFLLWDPEVTYTSAGIPSTAKLPATGTATPKLKAFDRAEPGAAVDSGLAPNELGQVPVIMYHQVVPDGGSEYDLTPAEFRAELQRLWDEHYRPITAADLVGGTIDVPEGTTPFVMAFDDASESQAALLPDGTIDPNTAVGIMLDFAKTHPGFEPAATFYVNGDPFLAGENRTALMTWLVENGFEIGNHTYDHTDLSTVSTDEVQRQFVENQRIIHAALPEYEIVTMALPFGAVPEPASLATEGSWDGESYAFAGVMLVGANPSVSPYSASFEPTAIPRIRSSPRAEGVENGSSYWLDLFAEDPQSRFVSDGNAKAITVPAGRTAELAEPYQARATES